MNNDTNLFIEVASSQKIKSGESISGDTCIISSNDSKNRITLILSDGLGSGIKAAVLSSLTTSMALRLFQNCGDCVSVTETIMKTLPVCSVRKISYATFTMVEIQEKRLVRVVEYDNPPIVVFRGGDLIEKEKQYFKFEHPILGEQKFSYMEFELQLGDRLICFSDGVTQSGMGERKYNFGWQWENAVLYISEVISSDPDVSARDLSDKIISKAWANDVFQAKDDITCACVYCRKPRKLLVVTGPPYDEQKDSYIAYVLKNYPGKKIICGGTTANIIARELGKEIKVDINDRSDDLPPIAYMEGVDLVTEGVITLSKLFRRLESLNQVSMQGVLRPSNLIDKMALLFLHSDVICFLVGTRINEMHQNPDLPVELDIRRNIVRRIKEILERRFLKEVQIEFV